MTVTSCLAIEMLCWFHHSSHAEYPGFDKPAQAEMARSFEADGIAEPLPGAPQGCWRLTAKGQAWLRMIKATPMPVQQWIDPRGLEMPQ